jgi:hypothetical protein
MDTKDLSYSVIRIKIVHGNQPQWCVYFFIASLIASLQPDAISILLVY